MAKSKKVKKVAKKANVRKTVAKKAAVKKSVMHKEVDNKLSILLIILAILVFVLAATSMGR